MTNWLTGCPVDRLTDWLTDWLADWLAEWLTDWLTDWLTGWPTNWLTDWLADWLTDWLTDRLTDWLTDWQARWQAGWLINWIYNIVSYWESDKLTYSEMLNDYRPNLPVHTLGFLIGGLRARTIPWFFGHFWKCPHAKIQLLLNTFKNGRKIKGSFLLWAFQLIYCLSICLFLSQRINIVFHFWGGLWNWKGQSLIRKNVHASFNLKENAYHCITWFRCTIGILLHWGCCESKLSKLGNCLLFLSLYVFLFKGWL